jgi:carboxylesterase type B
MRGRPWKLIKAADIAPEYIFDLFGNSSLNFLPWMPIVDDETLPLAPLDAFKKGVHNKLPTIISSTRNETIGFIPTLAMKAFKKGPLSSMAYSEALSAQYMTRASQIKKSYASFSDTAQTPQGTDLLGVVTTDSMVTCYTRYVAHVLSQHAPSFLSTFHVAPHSSEMDIDKYCVTGEPFGASCHAGDVGFFIPISDRMAERSKVGYANKQERNFAQLYTAAIIGFGAAQDGPFTAYNASADVSMSWGLDGPVKTVGYHKAHCDMFESLGFADHPWGSGDTPKDSPLPILI